MNHFLRFLLAFFLFVLPALAQTSPNNSFTDLPPATAGVQYQTSLDLQVTGAFPFHLEVTSADKLPQGLKLEQDATIGGVPASGTTGSHLFEVTVTDKNGARSVRVFRLVVAPAVAPANQGGNGSASTPVGARFSASPSVMNFGTQELGDQGASTAITITNDGDDNFSAGIPRIEAHCPNPANCDNNPDFVITDTSCATKLVKAATCKINVAFFPHHAGTLGDQHLLFGNVDVPLSGIGQHWKSPFTRLVTGLDISAASSGDTQQQFMVEAMLTAPLRFGHVPPLPPGHKEDPLDRRLWVFVNPRIASAPQAASAVSGLNINADFFNPILSGKTTDIVQTFDLKFGGEIFLVKPREGARFWGEYTDTDAKFSVSLVAMGGFLTPFSTSNRTSQVFVINDSIKNQFPEVVGSGKTNIAFVTQDRTRFMRSYYGGLRFKTYFFSTKEKDENGNAALYNLFPGTVDMTVGQDESVTGGGLHGAVFRVEGVYPLPYNPAFHVFAGANLGLSSNINSIPLNLQLPSSPVASSADSVFLKTVGLPNRDRYHIGLGVDLMQLFNRKSPSKPGNSQ